MAGRKVPKAEYPAEVAGERKSLLFQVALMIGISAAISLVFFLMLNSANPFDKTT